MVRHLVGMSAATVLIVACMFLPYLPGEYDGLAVALSSMSQLFAMAGLLLVPLGAIWLAYELRLRVTRGVTRPSRDLGYWFGLASIGALTMIAIVFAFGAFVSVGPSLGLGAIALWAYCAFRLAAKLKAMRNAEIRTFNWTPLYLIVLPLVAAIFMFTLLGPAAEFGRNRAIENSAALIGDIERYRDANGHYPRSLHAVWKDYKPSVIGVKQYHYEPNGDAYNVFFEHSSVRLGTREFVMYNKRDEHEMTSHAMDLLLLTPTELAAQRGYYAVHDTSSPHWKCFLFD